MGEVISIKRSSDEDLFAHFKEACPSVPASAEESIRLSAERALGGNPQAVKTLSFKKSFVAVAGVCVVGLLLANGVTSRWNNAVQSAASYTPIAANDTQSTELSATEPEMAAAYGSAVPSSDAAGSFKRARGAWAEYIARLESDPYYQYVEQEKRRFAEQYPE